jgi:aminopeptidase N
MVQEEKKIRRARGIKGFLLILILFTTLTLLEASPGENKFDIEHFTLNIEIVPERHWLAGEAKLRIRPWTDGLKSLSFYLRPTLHVKSIKDEKDHTLVFSQTTVGRIFPNSDTSLVRVELARELSKRETKDISVSYGGIFYMSSDFDPKERRYNRAFSCITKEAAWLRSVQLWYPYIAQKSMPLTIKTKVPSDWTVISNGELETLSQEKKKRVFVFEDENTSTLDIMLFAAPYVSKSEKLSDFHLTAYFFPHHIDFIDPYLEKTAEILGFYTQKFGRPKAEKFNIIEIGTGYGTGTSAPFGYAISSHLINLDFTLLPHEIAHLWWGETVSDNLGEDSWLHEGLATFSDYFFRSEKAPDKEAKRRVLFDMLNRAIPIDNPKTLSILEGGATHAPEGFLIYERAAFMLQTLKHILGEELFFKALRSYIDTFKEKKADTAGFIQVIHSVSQRNLNGFFDFYLRGERPPRYRVKFKNKKGRITCTLHQDDAPKSFRMPLTLEFITNQRSFKKKVEMIGQKRTFSYSLEQKESVSEIIIDPDFDVLAVREVLEDRWKARDLRLNAARRKNFDRVRLLLFALREKNPDNVYILHELAQFYFAQEKWERGIEFYRKIVSLNPPNFTFIALANIAGAYEMMGDRKSQRLYLEKALSHGSSMYSLMRRLRDRLEDLKEQGLQR